MHKTGSTSVQQNLAGVVNSPDWRLLTVGGRANMGPALHAMFSNEPHKCHWFTKLGQSHETITYKGEVWRRELQLAIEELTVENCIISSETLSAFNIQIITAFRDFIAPLFDEIRVIGYVRSPVAYKTSRFQEAVKHGNDRFNVTDIKLNYQGKFSKFDRVFDKANVILRKFDPKTFPNNCIVADFCEQIGIRFPQDVPISRVNESMSREACGILYAYRKFGPGYGIGKDVVRENLNIVKALRLLRGEKFKIPMCLFSQALELEGADIQWMENRLGSSLEETDLDNGTEVTSEQDLLTILQSSCEEFAARFGELQGITIPQESIPKGCPLDPRQVAEFVQLCRELFRQHIEKKRAEKRAEKQVRDGKHHPLLIGRIAAMTMRAFKRAISNLLY
jgi:hypothetical protein